MPHHLAQYFLGRGKGNDEQVPEFSRLLHVLAIFYVYRQQRLVSDPLSWPTPDAASAGSDGRVRRRAGVIVVPLTRLI